MVFYKTDEEVELLRASNQLVSKTLAFVGSLIRPGITTNILDKQAEMFIRDHGGNPGFLGYRGFPNTLCTSINDEVVHGIPSDEALNEGDILSVDCGVLLHGYFGDSAYTFTVGEPDQEKKKLLNVTREALFLGINQALPGKRIGDIAFAIQSQVESAGFSVVRELVGHGIGRHLHEKPEVPNFGRRGTGMILRKGLVICIEPMVNMGVKEIVQDNDGWTMRTRDGMPSAHFELAIAITDGKPDLLTDFNEIEKIVNK